jgi:hypothetical protein
MCEDIISRVSIFHVRHHDERPIIQDIGTEELCNMTMGGLMNMEGVVLRSTFV